MGVWPTDDITKVNLDETGDDPAQARAELVVLIDRVKEIIGALNANSGVCGLDSSGDVEMAQLSKAVLLAGDTMAGLLVLSGAPVTGLGAATKTYVDDAVSGSSPFGAGTNMLFRQTVPPTGWTKDSSFNNHALRVTTGTVTSLGGDDMSTVFGTSKSTSSHTLTTTETPAHTHGSGGAHTHVLAPMTTNFIGASPPLVNTAASSPGSTYSTNSAGTHTHTSVGGDGGHSHNLTNLNLKIVDIIIASKDA